MDILRAPVAPCPQRILKIMMQNPISHLATTPDDKRPTLLPATDTETKRSLQPAKNKKRRFKKAMSSAAFDQLVKVRLAYLEQFKAERRRQEQR